MSRMNNPQCIMLNIKRSYLQDLFFISWDNECEEVVFKKNPILFLQSFPLMKKRETIQCFVAEYF